jgi:aspartyl-tRNA(Asn)/glutamyl-tRNA(Gln) amidotransferase subunit C
MTKLTKEEALRIAQLAHIDIHEDEIEPLLRQLESVLSYAQRVTEVATDAEEPSTKLVNMFREDVVIKTDSEPILSQAPEREGDFFVVPVIISDQTSE